MKILLIIFLVIVIIDIAFLIILVNGAKHSGKDYSIVSKEEYEEFWEWMNNRNNKKEDERHMSCGGNG